MTSRGEVFQYIQTIDYCKPTECKYSDFCPCMVESAGEECLIRIDGIKRFDTFYNLYFGQYEGLKSELTDIAYNLKKNAKTPDDAIAYFNSLVKIMNACYAPEKQNKDDMITDILVNITPV